MALQWKRNTRYPSVTRPGVFPRIQEFDEVTGEDILQDTWFELTGIDEGEMNKFKFSLGTWKQLSRRNRKVQILPADESNTITYPITADDESATTEPKPDYLPDNYVSDIFAWANNIEEAKEGSRVEGVEAAHREEATGGIAKGVAAQGQWHRHER